jgi:hypothetical protein
MRHCRWLTAILALSMAGCVLRGKQQAKLPAVPPPPPQPAQGASPAVRPEPLSIPQTQAQLPPAQPLDPQALTPAQPPSQPVGAQAPPRIRPRPGVHGPDPSRPDPAAPAATAAVPAAQVATPAASPQPAPPAEGGEVREQVQEILPPEELKHLQDLVANQKQEVHRVIDPTVGRKLTPQQSAAVSRIQSFLQQLEEAEKRSDWRQANLLGERALILAREFQGAVR